MDHIVDGISRFQTKVFPQQRAVYEDLAKNGQKPQVLLITCSDSRVVPELFTDSGPGDMFVTRNAGNVVPPYSEYADGAVTSAIEYAVVGLGVGHVVVCGHSGCGAMGALLNPKKAEGMPTVVKWLDHCRCSVGVFEKAHKDAGLSDDDAARVLAMENVVCQLTHLRTHPCVASRVATGDLTLHGWLFDIETGDVLAMDGKTGAFSKIEKENALPVALPSERRAVRTAPHLAAAQ